MPLTVKEIEVLRPKEKRYMVSDGDGLFLEVMPSGSKLWRFRDQRGGKEQKLTLGRFPYMSLQEAREARFKLLKSRENTDDLREILNPPIKPTLAAAAQEWFSQNMAGRRAESHLKDIRSRLQNYIIPALGEMPVDEISAQDVLSMLHAIEAKGYHDLAHRVRNITGQVLACILRSISASIPLRLCTRHAPDWAHVTLSAAHVSRARCA